MPDRRSLAISAPKRLITRAVAEVPDRCISATMMHVLASSAGTEAAAVLGIESDEAQGRTTSVSDRLDRVRKWQRALVPRFRSSHHSAARSFANFGIEGH